MQEQIQHERNWYVVYTKPQKEEVAQFHLQTKGIEVFNPRLYLPETTRKSKRVIPLFPSYLFVRISIFTDEYQYVNWSHGIKRFVSFNDVPTPLDNGVVSFLKQQVNASGVIVARSNLKPGQEVQIEAGPFKGLVGVIQEPPDARGRVKVLMTLLSRQVHVEVPAGFVRSGWVPPYEC